VLVAYGKDGNLFRTVNRKPDWVPVYFDETHAVFVRVSSETRALVDALRINWNAPERREVPAAARMNPPDWLADKWPRVVDNIAPKSLGQLALLTGNLRLAHERFEEALRVRPDDADAALHLVVICRALGDDTCVANTLPQAGIGAGRITTPMAAASAFEGSDSLEAAVATYSEMIVQGKGSPDVYQKLAQAALGANLLDAAEKAYRHLADEQPNAAQYWNGLGLIAARRGAYDEALKHFERSLSIAPRQPAILTAVGAVHVKMGQRDLAREVFTRAVEIDPNYQPARQQLRTLEGR
jgi:tetratricopeptide (TPR) repeat protein